MKLPKLARRIRAVIKLYDADPDFRATINNQAYQKIKQKATNIMKSITKIINLVVVLSLIGCQTLQEHEQLSRLAVQFITIKVVKGKPDRAARVVQLMDEVKSHAASETAASVAILKQLVRDRINWDKLDESETLLVNELMNLVGDELTRLLGDGVLTSEQRLVVADVADWIGEAARLTISTSQQDLLKLERIIHAYQPVSRGLY